MHFFHQYLLYMTFEVAEPACHALQAALRAAATIDQVPFRPTTSLCRALTPDSGPP